MRTVRKEEMERREREQLGTPPLERKLHSVDNIAYNILFENTFHSNLVPDISKVDYLAGNLGPTDLQPLEGVGPFVDDMYIFGYCRKEQMECSGRRIWYKKSTGVLASSICGSKKVPCFGYLEISKFANNLENPSIDIYTFLCIRA